MGSDKRKDAEADEDELPEHRVRLTQAFHLGIYEVTQQQYEQVMNANPSNFKGGDLPVERVSWTEAVEFCKRLSARDGRAYRLPSEAEWEYACRAGTTTRYSFGDDAGQLSDHAWYSANSASKTHPVGQKQANGFGLYDMHGNVWEWCADWIDSGYYCNTSLSDPKGPNNGNGRVLRGGSWNLNPRSTRSADRVGFTPGDRYHDLGFRVVVSLPPRTP